MWVSARPHISVYERVFSRSVLSFLLASLFDFEEKHFHSPS